MCVQSVLGHLFVSYKHVFSWILNAQTSVIQREPDLFLWGVRWGCHLPFISPLLLLILQWKTLNNSFLSWKLPFSCVYPELSGPTFCFPLAWLDRSGSLRHYLQSIFLALWLFVLHSGDSSVLFCRAVQYSRAMKGIIAAPCAKGWCPCSCAQTPLPVPGWDGRALPLCWLSSGHSPV